MESWIAREDGGFSRKGGRASRFERGQGEKPRLHPGQPTTAKPVATRPAAKPAAARRPPSTPPGNWTALNQNGFHLSEDFFPSHLKAEAEKARRRMIKRSQAIIPVAFGTSGKGGKEKLEKAAQRWVQNQVQRFVRKIRPAKGIQRTYNDTNPNQRPETSNRRKATMVRDIPQEVTPGHPKPKSPSTKGNEKPRGRPGRYSQLLNSNSVITKLKPTRRGVMPVSGHAYQHLRENERKSPNKQPNTRSTKGNEKPRGHPRRYSQLLNSNPNEEVVLIAQPGGRINIYAKPKSPSTKGKKKPRGRTSTTPYNQLLNSNSNEEVVKVKPTRRGVMPVSGHAYQHLRENERKSPNKQPNTRSAEGKPKPKRRERRAYSELSDDEVPNARPRGRVSWLRRNPRNPRGLILSDSNSEDSELSFKVPPKPAHEEEEFNVADLLVPIWKS